MKRSNKEKRDIEECKEKILKILQEYNCTLMDFDEGDYVLIYDKDAGETINALN